MINKDKEKRAAKYMLAGFKIAYNKVVDYSYTGNRISELFLDLKTVMNELEKLAKGDD